MESLTHSEQLYIYIYIILDTSGSSELTSCFHVVRRLALADAHLVAYYYLDLSGTFRAV